MPLTRSSVIAAVTATAAAIALAPAGPAGAAPSHRAAGAPAAATGTPGTAAKAGKYVLTATARGPRYAPTFTGNGYLGVRVPPAGQGYAGGTVPALSELAGFYARPPHDVQQRANLPTWSTLRFGDGKDTFDLGSGRISDWRQQLDLTDGVISTSMRWHAPDGRVTDLRYDVFTDRAREHVGAVRLTLVPHWSGRASVDDLIDGRPATLTTAHGRGWQPGGRLAWERIRTVGTGIVAALATRVHVSAGHARVTPLAPRNQQSIGQRVSFAVRAGRAYDVTKYVGVADSNDSRHPLARARAAAAGARSAGYGRITGENAAAWHRLWAGRVDVRGNPTLATQVNASEFYLWSSTRRGSDWSISPAGLSSNGYDGHIFWDAETWMHPSLLAQHPALAAGMDRYRFERLHAAYLHARRTGNTGARFPWESALDGTEQIPPPVSVNSEGLYEQHITADIALAQWQYYVASGNKQWLHHQGWPVIRGAATFWSGRAVRSANGRFHLRHVTGPDEENPDVNDEAYTNVAAARTLQIGVQAARALGRHAPARWRRVARGLVLLFDRAKGIHPEFRGYRGQLVKQADVTMLQYPWGRPMPRAVAQRDLNYYVPRSDPGGPSMSDAINSIDTAALNSPGCASYAFTERSIQPFMRDVFDQFSETSTGGAFTFMTGIGGFLQEFLYGYSGLRMTGRGVRLDPSLSGAISGEVLHGLRWEGNTFTVAVEQGMTTVSVQSGPGLPVSADGSRRIISRGHALQIPTRAPAARPTADLVRCQHAAASTSARGAIPLAAVDGSPATDWQPLHRTGRLTVRLGAEHPVSHATLRWGRMWPPAPAPNVPPPPHPVTTVRPTAYRLLTSSDGRHWHVAARVRTRGGRVVDTLSFARVQARFVRVRIVAARSSLPAPMLDELAVRS